MHIYAHMYTNSNYIFFLKYQILNSAYHISHFAHRYIYNNLNILETMFVVSPDNMSVDVPAQN